MSQNLKENASLVIKNCLPFVVSVLVLLISFLPYNFFILKGVHVAVGISCVYFWLQHRPDLFNLWSAFGIGIIEDLISASPLGSNVFEVLLMYLLVNSTSRLFNAKPFIVLWYGFMALSLITLFSRWLIVSIYYSHFLPLSVLFFSYLVTIVLYPLLSLLMAAVQNKLIKEDF
ncbi:MAG: rod shape-determining protein MreD [Alphaproteobacteria bacterium]|nr:rod shape-determining protein MreD [Alphaproteobacteria bacterium]